MPDRSLPISHKIRAEARRAFSRLRVRLVGRGFNREHKSRTALRLQPLTSGGASVNPLNMTSPHQQGYRMPAEWAPHEATWLAWPHERTDWPGKFAPIPWVYADIVRHLARVERVRILVADRDENNKVQRILKQTGADLAAVDFFIVPTNRGWTRDFGPIFVSRKSRREIAVRWSCPDQLEIQRLGQIRRLAERQRRHEPPDP